MFPPATETGALALTAFWSLLAIPRAHWLVSAFWIPAWKPPAPPQPASQESLPSCLPSQRLSQESLPSCLPSQRLWQESLPPMFWLSHWSCSVLALLETSVVAVEVAVWLALEGPE